MSITDKVKAIRDELRLSQAEIARRLEIEPPSYHRLENRGDKLSFEQLQSIANALGVSSLYIITWGEAVPHHQNVGDRSEEIQMLRERIADLENSLSRANNIVDAFVYMMNGGKGMNEERAQEVAKTFEADLDKAMEDAAARMESTTDKKE